MAEQREQTIELSKGYRAVVDAEDFEKVNAHSWYAKVCPNGRVYAQRNAWNCKGCTGLSMHRFILGLTDRSISVDHINHDGLDNRRCNLRPCSNAQNQANARKPSTNKSGFKGVSFYKRSGRWRAQIAVDGKKIWLGQFDTPEAAARAFDAAALESFGQFAYLNCPREDQYGSR